MSAAWDGAIRKVNDGVTVMGCHGIFVIGA